MTIAGQTSKVRYAGSDAYTSPKAFTIPFYFVKDADIAVVRRGADGGETALTLTTHYTLSGAGDPQGGACTLLAAPATGETLVICRDPAIVQETDYQENDAFPAQTHEAALDLLTMIDQAQEEKLGRAVKSAISSGLDNLELPVASPGAALVWNAAGDGLANSAIGGIPASVAAAAASVADAAAQAAKAAQWAQEAEDVAVEPGKYSAYHWARQARAIAEDGLDAYRTPAPQLLGAATQTEYLDAVVTIANHDADAAYAVDVTGGTFARDGNAITWTMPAVAADTDHMLAVFATRPGELRSETTEHWITVVAIPIVSDDTVLFGADTVAADWPWALSAAAYSDTESQDAEETDWLTVQTAVDLALTSLTVDGASTVSSLVLSGAAITEGDYLLVNDGALGTDLEAIQVGSVTGTGPYTCAISPALVAVPDAVFHVGATEPVLMLATGNDGETLHPELDLTFESATTTSVVVSSDTQLAVLNAYASNANSAFYVTVDGSPVEIVPTLIEEDTIGGDTGTDEVYDGSGDGFAYDTYLADAVNMRSRIAADFFPMRVTKIKVAFQANSTTTYQNVYVGNATAAANSLSFDAAPTHFLFSGVNSASIGTTPVYTDLTDVNLDPAKPIVVAAYVGGTPNRYAKSGWDYNRVTDVDNDVLETSIAGTGNGKVVFAKIYVEMEDASTYEYTLTIPEQAAAPTAIAKKTCFAATATAGYENQGNGVVRVTSGETDILEGFRAVAMGVSGLGGAGIDAGRINLWKEEA
ncbi:MAG: hypothetical protein AB7E47_08730 [Desulfovibrionaceae bacterium]